MSIMAATLSARTNSACFNIWVRRRSNRPRKGPQCEHQARQCQRLNVLKIQPAPNTYIRFAYMEVKSRPPPSEMDRPPKTSRPTHCSEFLAVLHPVSGIRPVRSAHRFSSPAHVRGLMLGPAPRRSSGPLWLIQGCRGRELSALELPIRTCRSPRGNGQRSCRRGRCIWEEPMTPKRARRNQQNAPQRIFC